AILAPVQLEAEAVAAEGIREQDLSARVGIGALDAPDDLRVLEVPDLGWIAELEPVGHEHRAHRPVCHDRAPGLDQLLPTRHRRGIVARTGRSREVRDSACDRMTPPDGGG